MTASATSSEFADQWDAVFASWRESRATTFLRAYSDAVNRVLIDDWLPPLRAGRVLKTDLFDEAVGVGLAGTLIERAEKVFGIDVSPAVVRAARNSHPLLDARCADVRRLPYGDASFDFVVSNSTLDHFDDVEHIREALHELRRVLVPGGRLVITLDNLANPLVLIRNLLPPAFLRRLRLVPYPTGVTCGPRKMRRLLEECGFEVEVLRAQMHCPRLIARVAAAGIPWGASRLLRAVLAFERLGSAPTRHLTGQFNAALARRA